MLPKCASTENYASRVVVQLEGLRELKKRRSLAQLRGEQAARADEWRRALASGEVGSRAALARREGVSRAWVTKVLIAARSQQCSSCPPLLKRMADRDFDEIDLRTMLENASRFSPNVVPGRFTIQTRHSGRPWEVIVEPDDDDELLVVITAYPAG